MGNTTNFPLSLSTWIDAVRDAGVGAVADALGHAVTRTSVTPCPACGAERRSGTDPRGPVSLGRTGWYCYACKASGDAATFAAFAVVGDRLDRDNWKQVRDACAGLGLCAPGAIAGGVGRASWSGFQLAARATEATEGAGHSTFGRFGRTSSIGSDGAEEFGRFGRASHEPALAPTEEFGRFGRASSPPARPPLDEVHDLWERSLEVTDSSATREWLVGRGLSPADVSDLRLARALPPCGALPRWARSSAGSWRDSGHVLVMPLYGVGGALEAVRARFVTPEAKPAKALAPAGASVTGLVMACPLASLWLAGRPLGDVKNTASSVEVQRVGLVVTEGEPDFLSWATRWGIDGGLRDAPAVVGLVAGSWVPELAALVPDRTTVVARTHQDEAGDRYAVQVLGSLSGRCDVRRPRRGA